MGDMTKLAMQAIQGLFTSKPFQKRVGRLFSHPIALLAIATIFATIAGVWLTNYYQERAWIREKQFEAFRQGYAEALELIDELSEVMSRRVFGLNRVIWVAKGTGTGELDQVWNAYYQSVEEWNTKLLAYKGRLARSIGPGPAEALGNWEDPALTDSNTGPFTIHAHFFVAHAQVRALVDCVRQHCSGEEKANAIKTAEVAVNKLSLAVEEYIQACIARIHEYADQS